MQAQAQAEAGPQAEAQGDVELELLRRGLSAFPANEVRGLLAGSGMVRARLRFRAGSGGQCPLAGLYRAGPGSADLTGDRQPEKDDE
jgi:hypothetical protein